MSSVQRLTVAERHEAAIEEIEQAVERYARTLGEVREKMLMLQEPVRLANEAMKKMAEELTSEAYRVADRRAAVRGDGRPIQAKEAKDESK